MNDLDLTSEQFVGLAKEILSTNRPLRFRARGFSMNPFIRDGDMLEVHALSPHGLKLGEVVMFNPGSKNLLVHRVVRRRTRLNQAEYLVQGDAVRYPDGWVHPEHILGSVHALERAGRTRRLDTSWGRMMAFSLACLLPAAKTIYNAYRRLIKLVFAF